MRFRPQIWKTSQMLTIPKEVIMKAHHSLLSHRYIQLRWLVIGMLTIIIYDFHPRKLPQFFFNMNVYEHDALTEFGDKSNDNWKLYMVQVK